MSVQDLIELLQRCPQDFEVWIVSRQELASGKGEGVDDVVIELNLNAVSLVRKEAKK